MSPLPEESEEEDEIEEDIQVSLDVEQTGRHNAAWQPGDMIVLEFAPKPGLYKPVFLRLLSPVQLPKMGISNFTICFHFCLFLKILTRSKLL